MIKSPIISRIGIYRKGLFMALSEIHKLVVWTNEDHHPSKFALQRAVIKIDSNL